MFGFFDRSINTAKQICTNMSGKLALTLPLLWQSVDGFTCWEQNDVTYLLNCDKQILHAQDLESMLMNLTLTTCENITALSSCFNYPSKQGFGSDFYNARPLCTLRYPLATTPDPCTVAVLQNNTPSGGYSIVLDSIITGAIATGSLLTMGLFAVCAAKYCRRQPDTEQEKTRLLDDTSISSLLEVNSI